MLVRVDYGGHNRENTLWRHRLGKRGVARIGVYRACERLSRASEQEGRQDSIEHREAMLRTKDAMAMIVTLQQARRRREQRHKRIEVMRATSTTEQRNESQDMRVV
jgi:hypothetical protein